MWNLKGEVVVKLSPNFNGVSKTIEAAQFKCQLGDSWHDEDGGEMHGVYFAESFEAEVTLVFVGPDNFWPKSPSKITARDPSSKVFLKIKSKKITLNE